MHTCIHGQAGGKADEAQRNGSRSRNTTLSASPLHTRHLCDLSIYISMMTTTTATTHAFSAFESTCSWIFSCVRSGRGRVVGSTMMNRDVMYQICAGWRVCPAEFAVMRCDTISEQTGT
jgi:hypothetical protein